jgi:hypothetical protein
MYKIILAVFTVFLLSGCAHHVKSTPFPIDHNKVNSFSSSGKISIDNNQTSNNDYLIFTVSGHEYFANLNQVTETAKTLLTEEIGKNRALITESDSEKTIKISVEKITTEVGNWGALRIILELKAETGEGESVAVMGNNYSPRGIGGVLDGAISLAVISLLNDETIQTYLK